MACAPNHTLSQPCALPTETDLPGMNFNGSATDVYSFLLKGGQQYRIGATVDANGGLDPSIDLFLAGGAEQPLASNDDAAIGDPSAAVTVTVETDAWYLARVVNQAPGDPLGKTYMVSARSSSPTSAGATPAASDPDDLIGNAYDAAHAVRLAWGVPYDLSMACPDARPGACYAGRHVPAGSGEGQRGVDRDHLRPGRGRRYGPDALHARPVADGERQRPGPRLARRRLQRRRRAGLDAALADRPGP